MNGDLPVQSVPPAGAPDSRFVGRSPTCARRTTVNRRCDGGMNRVPANAVLLTVTPEVVSRPNRIATPGRAVPRSSERRPRRCRGLHRLGSQPLGREGQFAEAGDRTPVGSSGYRPGLEPASWRVVRCWRPMFADAAVPRVVVPGAAVPGAAGALGRLPWAAGAWGCGCLGLHVRGCGSCCGAWAARRAWGSWRTRSRGLPGVVRLEVAPPQARWGCRGVDRDARPSMGCRRPAGIERARGGEPCAMSFRHGAPRVWIAV